MRVLQGTVTSLKRVKTATVEIIKMWQHPIYLKSVKRSKKYACHYEDLVLELGDVVEIKESRPISKTKRFVIVKKVNK